MMTKTAAAAAAAVEAAGTAATVNGEDISMQDFRRIYQRQRQEWERNYRAQIPDMLAEGMADEVVNSLVRNRVVAQHVLIAVAVVVLPQGLASFAV